MCSPVFALMFQNATGESDGVDVVIADVNSANHFEDFLAMISPDRKILLNRKFLVVFRFKLKGRLPR